MGNIKYKVYYQGAIYHVYNRGNARQEIFREDADYRFYLIKLQKNLLKHNVSLLFYVLMPNHIHLVLSQNTENPIHRLISSQHTGYSMYFNKKYKRVGHLFQSRFLQRIVESDEDLAYLSCYVHLNPLHDNLVSDTTKYVWSSYGEYIGLSSRRLCDAKDLEAYFKSQGQSFRVIYKKFVDDMSPIIKENKLIKRAFKDSPW